MTRYAALLFPLVAINLALADPRQGVNLARRANPQHAKDNGNINNGNGNGASITGAGNNGGAGTNPTAITTALASTITTFTVVGSITETEIIFATTDANNKVTTVTSTLAANGIGAGAGTGQIKDQVPGTGSSDPASGADTGNSGTSGSDTSGSNSGTGTTGTGTTDSGAATGDSGTGTTDTSDTTCNEAPAAMMATTITQCDPAPTNMHASGGKQNYKVFPVRPGHRELIAFYEQNKGHDLYYVKVSFETILKGDSKAKGFTTYVKGHDGQPKVTGTGQNGQQQHEYQNGQQNGQNGQQNGQQSGKQNGQQTGQNGQQNGQGNAQNEKKVQGKQGN